MSSVSLFQICILLLFVIYLRPLYGLNTTSSSLFGSTSTSIFSTTKYFMSYTTTSIKNVEEVKEEHIFTNPWIYLMEVTGSLGLILISIMSIHAIYNIYKKKLSDKCSRIIYIIFFLSYWLTCVAYTFFRTNLILPMGKVIPCTFGFFLGTNSVFIAKLFLFIIFLLRIDLAFHSSALGYNRYFLSLIMIIYTIMICLLNFAFIWDANNLIGLYSSSLTNIDVCTTGNSSDYYLFIVGSMGLGDMVFSILVGLLFVCKLRKVNKLTQDSTNNNNKSKTEMRRMNTLTRLMRKQTILVLLAVISSITILGLGAVFVGFSLLMAVDATINVFCVWLMFRFSDPIWNKITRCFCYCCYCFGEKDDFLMTMHSFSIRKKLSIHSSTSGGAGIRSNTITKNENPSETPPVPITQRHSQKQNDIQIKFDNNITTEDLNKNKKKIKIRTTTTTISTETTTVKKEIIEETSRSIDSPLSKSKSKSNNNDHHGYESNSHKLKMNDVSSESIQNQIENQIEVIELQQNN